MLTTGEIQQVILDKDNKLKYSVRLPLFENPGQTTPFVVPCYVCYAPGNINNYVVGDRVFIDFLTDKYNTPIIVGKIYRGDESQATNYSFDNKLVVTNSAVLPQNTVIGDISGTDLINMQNQIGVHDELINNLVTKTDGGDEDDDFPVIEIGSLLGDIDNVDITDESEQIVYLSVKVVSGTVKAGDEVALFLMKKQKNKGLPGSSHSARTRYKLRAMNSTRVVAIADNQKMFFLPIPCSNRYLFKDSYKYTNYNSGPALRYVKLRRKLTPTTSDSVYDALSSNIIQVRFVYHKQENLSDTSKLRLL